MQNGPKICVNIARWVGDNCPFYWENAQELMGRVAKPMERMVCARLGGMYFAVVKYFESPVIGLAVNFS